MKYFVEFFSPVTRGGGIVQTTVDGVSREEAEKVAAEGNQKFKPLQYAVRELQEVKASK